MRDIARKMGYWSVRLQRVYREFLGQLNTELDALDAPELRQTIDEVRSIQSQAQSIQKELIDGAKNFVQDGQSAMREPQTAVRAALEETENLIAPPPPPIVDVEGDPNR